MYRRLANDESLLLRRSYGDRRQAVLVVASASTATVVTFVIAAVTEQR